jgi:B9 domain-containing protein 1
MSEPRNGLAVWNFPLDLSFKSTNAFWWPQVIVTTYGSDFLGRDVVRGYSSVYLPTSYGRSILYMDLFTPLASSGLVSIIGTLMGRTPELVDPKFVARSEGRQVTRVQSDGTIKLIIDCTMKGFEKYFDK